MGMAFGEVTGGILREVGVSVARAPLTLTDKQMETLRPVKLLGTGTTASAYLRDDGKVVKFTVDSQDVSALTRAQAIPHVAKLYESYNLPQRVALQVALDDGVPGSTDRAVFALVMKRYGAFPDRQEIYAEILLSMPPLPPSDRLFDMYVIDPFLRRIKRDFGYNTDTTAAEAFARQLYAEIYDTVRKLDKLGISMNDIHKGNIMYDSDERTWVFIDLGRSRIPVEEAYKVSKSLGGLGRWHASRCA